MLQVINYSKYNTPSQVQPPHVQRFYLNCTEDNINKNKKIKIFGCNLESLITWYWVHIRNLRNEWMKWKCSNCWVFIPRFEFLTVFWRDSFVAVCSDDIIEIFCVFFLQNFTKYCTNMQRELSKFLFMLKLNLHGQKTN